jgi:hypothetical protein
MRVMAEKGGMHMSLAVKREDKVRLPRGNDTSSIWLKTHARAQANMQRTLFEAATGTFPSAVSMFAASGAREALGQ